MLLPSVIVGIDGATGAMALLEYYLYRDDRWYS